MRKKDPVPFSQKIPNADPLALKLLEKLLAFDPKDRTTAEELSNASWNASRFMILFLFWWWDSAGQLD